MKPTPYRPMYLSTERQRDHAGREATGNTTLDMMGSLTHMDLARYVYHQVHPGRVIYSVGTLPGRETPCAAPRRRDEGCGTTTKRLSVLHVCYVRNWCVMFEHWYLGILCFPDVFWERFSNFAKVFFELTPKQRSCSCEWVPYSCTLSNATPWCMGGTIAGTSTEMDPV